LEVHKIANKLNELALGYAGAVVSAATMLLLGIRGNVGIYSDASQQMRKGICFLD
jgi:hypothetical protein